MWNTDARERFMLHYNFPPYSVGEVGMMGSTKRREIGHGRLARRAVTAVLPNMEDYPYVLRVVSDITESNGSSSMATVCGSILAMMDAGVQIKTPVAGIAMGLVKDGYCEDTGEPIGIKRLEARPIATLSIEAQERHERLEKTQIDCIFDNFIFSISYNRITLFKNMPRINLTYLM